MDEFTRMVFPRPEALPVPRRRRFWMHPGEPRQFGALCLSLQADVQDGTPQRPYFHASVGTLAGRLPIQAMRVPALPGLVLAPLAVRLQGSQRLLSVLMELRAEGEAVSLEASA